MVRIPYVGGSKARETAILRYSKMSVAQRTKLLGMPSVKRRKSLQGKFNAMIDIIMKR